MAERKKVSGGRRLIDGLPLLLQLLPHSRSHSTPAAHSHTHQRSAPIQVQPYRADCQCDS